MGLISALGHGTIALDTAPFIYFIEEHPDFLPVVAPLFEEVAAGRREIVTSAVTLLEVLVVPYRIGNLPIAERFEALLTKSRGLHLVEIDRQQLRAAAQLRALYNIRTPDALQLSAAMSRRCRFFVTGDRKLPDLPNLRILQLHDYL
jgi:predicted nucleic acid-binding protein